jgi:hypothetical protein
MEAITDNPLERPEDDQYGFHPYARILADMVRDTSNLPFCMGVFGRWGTGKSSLMRLIECQVTTFSGVRAIWFNPWKYHRREELWSALIRAVLSRIKEDGNQQAKDLATSLLKTTAWSVIKRAVGPLTMGVVSGEELEKLKDAFAKTEEQYQRHVNAFEDDFAELVKEYTSGGKLALFIDDLDRCLPESAITVLESLKLFIGHAQCVFVLGMDKSVVEMGIQKLYGDQIKMSGRDYLDKIIQVPFHIPPVPFERLKDSLAVAKTANYPPPIWQVLQHGMGGNPRKTKRFVNSFYLLRQILLSPDIDELRYGPTAGEGTPTLSIPMQDVYLAKLLVIQLTFPSFYELLSDNPAAWKIYEERLIGGNPEQRKGVLVDYPELQAFGEDVLLRRFMGATSATQDGVMPAAPDAKIVASLLRATSLVSERSSPEPATSQRPFNVARPA